MLNVYSGCFRWGACQLAHFDLMKISRPLIIHSGLGRSFSQLKVAEETSQLLWQSQKWIEMAELATIDFLKVDWNSDPDPNSFSKRHLGSNDVNIQKMVKYLGLSSLDQLIEQVMPVDSKSDSSMSSYILSKNCTLSSDGMSEFFLLSYLGLIASKNNLRMKSYIGMGYHNTVTPSVIQRHLLENPAWYTSYTPYQAEISQGRLESLVNFQTMISDLTGLPLSNASLLDEPTAAAEAMIMAWHLSNASLNDNAKSKDIFWVSNTVHPQTIAVLKSRAYGLGITLVVGPLTASIDYFAANINERYFGCLIQYPDTLGSVTDFIPSIASRISSNHGYMIVAADLLSLALLKSPGELGADLCVGSTQRFGVPLGYGGPHAAFISCKQEFARKIPGRLVGWSKDYRGTAALRLALQTREQHIRREKATSNICTAQALPANMATMYAIYHGPKGLSDIACRVHFLTHLLAFGAIGLGHAVENTCYFDTLTLRVRMVSAGDLIKFACEQYFVNLRQVDEDRISITLDETVSLENLLSLIKLLALVSPTLSRESINTDYIVLSRILGNVEEAYISLIEDHGRKFMNLRTYCTEGINFSDNKPLQPCLSPSSLRTTSFLQHPVFNSYHTETEMTRYLYNLSSKDISLIHSMIPLGSCTMKLNAASELMPISWPSFNQIHPFAPSEQAAGYHFIIKDLSRILLSMTGFDGISFMPNSGAQGEYTALLVIKRYFDSRQEPNRDICLIPLSAHGTNPASAAMAGYKIVVVKTTPDGATDIQHLRALILQYDRRVALMMITIPSTFGKFDSQLEQVTNLVHSVDAQVYMDGANFNAMLGLSKPAIDWQVDACHINCHKTLCIPHGGGGPGMGPILVKSHLVPYLPHHPIVSPLYHISDSDSQSKEKTVLGIDDGVRIDPTSATPYGSTSLLLVSWAYLKLMGLSGIQMATKVAVLNANYMMARLRPSFKILYTGAHDRVAHEFIIDPREFDQSASVQASDIAKRLQDYGFHAPTMSWPIPNTLMIEPTESESLVELDRFIESLISIRNEIDEIIAGKYSKEINVLKLSPHTLADLTDPNGWHRPYSIEKAVFPLNWLKERKSWPSVNRIDDAYGDRNLNCSCPSISSYTSSS